MRHVLATAAMLALTACSGSEDRAAVGEDVPDAGLPDCDTVWQPGARLPDGYQGCAGPTYRAMADWQECVDGSRYTFFVAPADGENLTFRNEAPLAAEGGRVISEPDDVLDFMSDCNDTPRVTS